MKVKRLLHPHVHGPAGGALVAALLVLALLLPAWQRAGQWYQAQRIKEQRSAMVEEVALLGNALSSVINRRFARLQGLEAFVQTQLQTSEAFVTPEVWEIFAAALYADTQGIRNFAIAPGGVVRYVYPLTGNENVVGYVPLQDPRPEVRADVQRAIESRAIILSGPVELIQGGLGLIARRAIYYNDAYWGLINIVLDVPALLKEAGFEERSGESSLALRDSDGRVFVGSGSVFQEDPIINRIALPEGEWELAGVPGVGWAATVRESLRVFQVAGLIIVGLLAGLTYLSVNRQARLSMAVRDRTRELRQAYQLLEERIEERTRELSTLLELSNSLASTLELAPLVERVLDQLQQVVDYTGASVLILEGEQLQVVGHRGPPSRAPVAQIHFPLDELGAFWTAMQGREPLVIDDVQQASTEMQQYLYQLYNRQKTTPDFEEAFGYVRAWMGIPLVVQERLIGALSIDHCQPNTYTPRHAALALAIANQAAVAIENARLYGQARRLAALEERQRLARELHDSVSQVLYSIGLGARTARALLDRDPGQAVEPVEYVLSLADAGLAEMRALIFELRPDSLEKEGLTNALGKQATALRARHNLEVHTELCDEPALPFEVKEGLYRMAQEALNNVVKHAQAGRVEVRLRRGEGRVILEVQDDGVGFDARAEHPGHLGLHTMEERAARLGGALEIKSEPRQGTLVRACIPLNPSKSLGPTQGAETVQTSNST